MPPLSFTTLVRPYFDKLKAILREVLAMSKQKPKGEELVNKNRFRSIASCGKSSVSPK